MSQWILSGGRIYKNWVSEGERVSCLITDDLIDWHYFLIRDHFTTSHQWHIHTYTIISNGGILLLNIQSENLVGFCCFSWGRRLCPLGHPRVCPLTIIFNAKLYERVYISSGNIYKFGILSLQKVTESRSNVYILHDI